MTAAALTPQQRLAIAVLSLRTVRGQEQMRPPIVWAARQIVSWTPQPEEWVEPLTRPQRRVIVILPPRAVTRLEQMPPPIVWSARRIVSWTPQQVLPEQQLEAAIEPRIVWFAQMSAQQRVAGLEQMPPPTARAARRTVVTTAVVRAPPIVNPTPQLVGVHR